MSRLVLLMATCLIATLTFAAPCDDPNGCTTTRSFKEADAQLTALQQTLIDKLHDRETLRWRLINTQRIWRNFRDAECQYVSSYGEQAEHYQRCAQAMSEGRIRALQRYLECTEAGGDCKVVTP